MELHLKTEYMDLSLTVGTGEQDTAQLLLAELAHAGVLTGISDQRQTLMARYTAYSQPTAYVPQQNVLPMGHVPQQNVLPMGQTTGYVPTIPNSVPKSLDTVREDSPRWYLIAILVGASIGGVVLSWRLHNQPPPIEKAPAVSQKPVNLKPPSFPLKQGK